MFDALYPWMHLVGRVLFAMVFIAGGISHFAKWNDMTAYATSKGVPMAKAGVAITGLMSLVGGVLVVLGWHRFIGAGLLAIFMLLTSTMMHAFWKEKDPMARMTEMSQFQKDLALGGAALVLAFYAGWSWPMSLSG